MTIQFTPNLALPYPQGTDQVSLGATDMQNIVQTLDGGAGASTSGPTAALVKKGTFASLPAAGQPLGSVYICTDTACGFWSDGTKWHYIPIDSSGPPIGAIMQYGGSNDPVDPDGVTRWLICDGRGISRSTYATLFARYSTTFGSGNGSTTFNIPDGRGNFMLGKATSGTGQTLGHSGGSIDHTHGLATDSAGAKIGPGVGDVNNLHWNAPSGNGSFSDSSGAKWQIGTEFFSTDPPYSGSLAGLKGNSDTANPPFLVVNHIIRAL